VGILRHIQCREVNTMQQGHHVRMFYSTVEACRMANISKNTFFRWVREGRYEDVANRDARGWRLFTPEEIARLKAEVDRRHGISPGRVSGHRELVR
jgi:predicted site-specific integrase-resolvase